MPEPEKRIIEFDRLNALGKAVFVGGQGVRLLANLIEGTLEKAATLFVEAERAFLEGRGEEIEDAKILEEHHERP